MGAQRTLEAGGEGSSDDEHLSERGGGVVVLRGRVEELEADAVAAARALEEMQAVIEAKVTGAGPSI